MLLGQNETIQGLPGGILRVDVQDFKVESYEYVDGRKRSSDMTGVGRVSSSKNALPHSDRDRLQLLEYVPFSASLTIPP